jgi:hypothetical protein
VLSNKVIDFELDYFDENNVSVTDPSGAELIKVTLTLGEKIYGRDLVVPTSITMKKVN